MQVSGASNLTWLQSVGLAGQTGQAPSADGQSLFDDASGAEASSASPLAVLQSPGQQFSADGLSALISAQAGETQDAQTQDTHTQGAQAQGASSLASPSAQGGNPVRGHHYHHRRVQVDPSDGLTTGSSAPSDAVAAPTTAIASNSAANDASSMLAQLSATL